MFRMSMGSKSQKQHRTAFSGISRVISPISALECGTPTTPPCDVERSTGSESYSGEKDGVKGTFTKTNFQTDFIVKDGKPGSVTPGTLGTPGKPGGIIPGTPMKGPQKPFKNPLLPNQTYKQFQEAEYGTPGKTAEKYKPVPTEYGNSKRQSLSFVPDKIPPPPSTPEPLGGGLLEGDTDMSLTPGVDDDPPGGGVFPLDAPTTPEGAVLPREIVAPVAGGVTRP